MKRIILVLSVPMALSSFQARGDEFRKVNYLQPSAGAVKGDFTMRFQVGHRIAERFSLEVGGAFTPETSKEFSLLIYDASLKINIPEIAPADRVYPFVSVGGGSYTRIGMGRRETDPMAIQEGGLVLEVDDRLSAMLGAGVLTRFGENDTLSLGFYFTGLAFVF